MKVILDTNIYIATMRFINLDRMLIWKLLEEGITIVLTDFIIEELRENFREKYRPEEWGRALDLLLKFLGTGYVEVKRWDEYSYHIEEARKLTNEKDAPLLAAAMLDDVDFLITRDKKAFLENEKLRGTPLGRKVHSPQSFLAHLRTIQYGIGFR